MTFFLGEKLAIGILESHIHKVDMLGKNLLGLVCKVNFVAGYFNDKLK